MNKTVEETEAFINAFLPMVKDVTDVDSLIAPPFTSIGAAAGLLKGDLREAAAFAGDKERSGF